MATSDRYCMPVGNIGQAELDLLECLLCIDRGQPVDSRAGELLERLVEAGVVDSCDGHHVLTLAGIERCRSLQHRIAADREAAKVLAARGLILS